MARNVTEYRCLIISPSDVVEERKAASDVIHRWNAANGVGSQVRIEAVLWETHSHPATGDHAQKLLNPQIVDDADFAVAIFWSKLGSPTPTHDSGSIEEIERMLSKGKQVMVYRSSRDIPQDRAKSQDFVKLDSAFERLRQRALYRTFDSVEDFRQHLVHDLQLLVHNNATPATAVVTAPLPDIRVNVSTVMTVRMGSPIAAMEIKVLNYSPHPFFLASILLELETRERLFMQVDPIRGEHNTSRRVEAGDSFSFFVLAEALKGLKAEVLCAVARDKVEREFKSDAETTRRVVQALRGAKV